MTEPRGFTCYLCGGTFWTQTTQAEMGTEVVELYGESVPDDELESLCDECYKRSVAAARTGGLIE